MVINVSHVVSGHVFLTFRTLTTLSCSLTFFLSDGCFLASCAIKIDEDGFFPKCQDYCHQRKKKKEEKGEGKKKNIYFLL
jgi:hypothetical protein